MQPVLGMSSFTRITIGFVSIMCSILLLAHAFGLVPSHDAVTLERRKVFCEELAIHCSLSAQRGDLSGVQSIFRTSVPRHSDIRSAGLRKVDGKLIIEMGNHDASWVPLADGESSPTQVRVPISLADRLWGQVEVAFTPLGPPGVLAPLHNPVLPLLLFCGSLAYFAYYFYVRFILRGINAAQSRVIPKRVRTTLNTLAEGVVILDKEERIVMANDAFASVVGRSAQELQGRKVADLNWSPVGGDGAEEFPWARAINEGAKQTGFLLGLDHDGNGMKTLSVNTTPIMGEDGKHKGAFATFDNLTNLEKKNAYLKKLLRRLQHSRTEVRRQNQQLKALATKDPLTGCLNRRAFFPELENRWAAAQRYGQSMSCVMVDIDKFKSINDTYGHGVGDQVLQQVAGALQGMLRKTDLICRYGGEEFCVLLDQIDIEQAMQAAERYRQGIESRTFANIPVTVSVGVSSYKLGASDPRTCLDQADKALYVAKRRGRNRAVRWDEIANDPEACKAEQPRTAMPEAATAGVDIPFHAVTALFSALAYRHADTAEHSRRVADMCVATAHGLMTQSECYILEVAAMLHDIGKLGVPDAVLLKPGPLNKEEWKIIRTHEHIGEEIIAAAFTSEELSEIAVNHHAWFGGTPYDPNMMKGNEIPLGARILCIADAYDAMVSDRVYRKGRSQEEAFAELRKWAGVQFDPDLVERFIKMIIDRDENRGSNKVAVSKQSALQIGLQIEKLAIAVDTQDLKSISLMAKSINATAVQHEVAPIAEAATNLESSVEAGKDINDLMELTVRLMELCRSTFDAYLPGPIPMIEDEEEKAEVAKV